MIDPNVFTGGLAIAGLVLLVQVWRWVNSSIKLNQTRIEWIEVQIEEIEKR